MTDLNLNGLTKFQLRLFAIRCARRVRHLMRDPRSVAALDVAERHARGEATNDELREAWAAAWDAWDAAHAARAAAAWAAAVRVSKAAARAAADAAAAASASRNDERAAQIEILAEIRQEPPR